MEGRPRHCGGFCGTSRASVPWVLRTPNASPQLLPRSCACLFLVLFFQKGTVMTASLKVAVEISEEGISPPDTGPGFQWTRGDESSLSWVPSFFTGHCLCFPEVQTGPSELGPAPGTSVTGPRGDTPQGMRSPHRNRACGLFVLLSPAPSACLEERLRNASE